MNSDKNIGFIGLGNVGSKLANSLIIGGYQLFIYDLDYNKGKNLIKKGAKWSKNIFALLKNSNIVITCLPSPKTVSSVVEEMSKFIDKRHLWIEMSTTDENEMKRR